MNLQEIFSRVLNMSLTGSVVICFVLAARLLLRRAPKVFSYALWSVVLFRLLCPVSISSALSLLNFTRASASEPDSIVTAVDYPMVLDIYQYRTELGTQEPEKSHTHQQHTPSIPENEAVLPQAPDAAPGQAPAEPGMDLLTFAAYIWLVGIGLLVVYNLYACHQLSKKIAGSVRLRKNIYLADHIPSPFVLGVFRPRIYLPSVLDASERKYIIAHERCHIRRKDHIVKLLGYTALCIHWFNPLVWLAFTLSGKDMEMSCDEAVIGMYGPKIRADYSASLLRLATGHRFIRPTPLAFGEGDAKGRVINMAKWKKPGLWVILCALILCMGVLAACATNPKETEPQAEPTLNLTEVEAESACEAAVNALRSAESYCILYEYESLYLNRTGTQTYRRHGNNLLVDHPEGSVAVTSHIYYEGVYGMFMGDYWVNEDQPSQFDPNEWLEKWSMEGKTILSTTLSGNSVTFEATWPYELDPEGEYRGSYTYTLNADGALVSIAREYVLYVNGGETAPTGDKITVQAEDPEDTLSAIETVAAQCISQAELEEIRYQNKVVSEIPSNKTDFDRDFALGAGQMRWRFLNDDWQFALGAENPTSTSVTLFHCESDDDHQSLIANDGFWLEVLVDGQWRYVDESKTQVDAPEVSVDVSWTQTGRYSLDWSDSYGALQPGFYRVGRYYTVTMNSGETDTVVCYAKFRLYDENQDELIKKCRNGITALLEQESYHLHLYEKLDSANFKSFEYEHWKYGSNYMSFSESTRVDGGIQVGGSMFRGGEGYSLSWVDDDVTKPLRNWSTADSIDIDNYHFWQYDFTVYDSEVTGVMASGNQISIFREIDNHEEVAKTEVRFTFKDDGTLASIQKIRHGHDGSTVVEAFMEVLDTPAEDIQALINSQDVSKPPAFSWAEDKDKYPNAQTSGFVNTQASPVKSMDDALWLADKECTMQPQDALAGERYNIVEIAYDADAGIWRVFLQFSQNIDGDQIIYLNDQGITQMIVITEGE